MRLWQTLRREVGGALRSFRYDAGRRSGRHRLPRRTLVAAVVAGLVIVGGISVCFAFTSGFHITSPPDSGSAPDGKPPRGGRQPVRPGPPHSTVGQQSLPDGESPTTEGEQPGSTAPSPPAGGLPPPTQPAPPAPTPGSPSPSPSSPSPSASLSPSASPSPSETTPTG